MKFEDSGLQNDKLVEDAFNYADAYTQSLGKEMLQGYEDLVNMGYRDELDMLEEDLERGDITPKQYAEEKAMLERMRAEDLKEMMPADIAGKLNKMFHEDSLSPALEIQKYSEKSSPALIAASLLAPCVRDPVDCAKVAKNFGNNIAGLIAEKLHVEAYPSARNENIAAASSDAKRLFMGELTNSLRQAAAMATKTGPREKVILPLEQMETTFTEAKLLWGTDKKLDERLVNIFNHATQIIFSPLKMEVNEKGIPELVKNTRKNPPKPVPGKKPRNFGDNGF